MGSSEQFIEDYKSFETLATGAAETKAKAQMESQLDSIEKDELTHRYAEALLWLYRLGWNPPEAKN